MHWFYFLDDKQSASENGQGDDAVKTTVKKPTIDTGVNLPSQSEDSHFMVTMITVTVIVAVIYVLYHNKQKILGLIIEGGRPPGGGSKGRRSNVRYRRVSQQSDEDNNYKSMKNNNVIY